MSEILMKEMESVSLTSPKKEEERRDDGVSSFLLVDEQENLRVNLANLSRLSCC